MSLELKDFRGRITVETDCVLEALCKTTKKDKAEIAREWLHEKAMEQVHIASLVQANLIREGLCAASQIGRAGPEGGTGKSRESGRK